MSHAMELIVEGFIRLKDRQFLENLMMHRGRLAMDLKARTGFDCKATIAKIDQDISIIEAGLSALSNPVLGEEGLPKIRAAQSQKNF
ncbi:MULTISPECIES: hypothetical protein [unclassified Bradyrhizobium]|uniref:hypothetical protein n=2 Tax=Bradyrhizobium TaxID=374 RepID=UPI001CD80CD9|nr:MULTISPECIES: hypothetical protein [unclassified Bradyrhizobium]MCA1378895.1 hypothetical protein [Bradyrhizobium sp. IC4060]MCA1488915.1 hypothetical protein [Bradyrhizobium sp. IC4061]